MLAQLGRLNNRVSLSLLAPFHPSFVYSAPRHPPEKRRAPHVFLIPSLFALFFPLRSPFFFSGLTGFFDGVRPNISGRAKRFCGLLDLYRLSPFPVLGALIGFPMPFLTSPAVRTLLLLNVLVSFDFPPPGIAVGHFFA